VPRPWSSIPRLRIRKGLCGATASCCTWNTPAPGVKIWDGKTFGTFWSGAHCGASGLIAYGHDHLLVACYDSNSIVELDGSGKTVRRIDRDSAGKPFVGPNDFAADGAGGAHTLYITGVFDQFKPPYAGAVYRFTQ